MADETGLDGVVILSLPVPFGWPQGNLVRAASALLAPNEPVARRCLAWQLTRCGETSARLQLHMTPWWFDHINVIQSWRG